MKIQEMTIDECIDLLNEIDERLGLVGAKQYMEITAYPKTRQMLYQDKKVRRWKNMFIIND